METPATTPTITSAAGEADIRNFIHTPPVAAQMIGDQQVGEIIILVFKC